jgi:hypothetical protein
MCFLAKFAALAWKVYPADAENKQDGLDHIDFFLALISAGYIYPYDVTAIAVL